MATRCCVQLKIPLTILYSRKEISIMLDLVKVGKKINKLRKENSLSQDDVADKLYISRQSVSKWELGLAIPTIDNVIELSKIFNVDIKEILCLNEDDEFDSNDIFKNHSREYVINSILNGKIVIDFYEHFDEFTIKERMIILNAVKRKKISFNDKKVYKLLTDEEKKFLRN